jgi:hypothetical protein
MCSGFPGVAGPVQAGVACEGGLDGAGDRIPQPHPYVIAGCAEPLPVRAERRRGLTSPDQVTASPRPTSGTGRPPALIPPGENPWTSRRTVSGRNHVRHRTPRSAFWSSSREGISRIHAVDLG